MGPRRTNLALLVVLLAALGTGGLAFAAGTGWGRPVVVGHAVAGLAVLVLAPWKSVIVRRGLGRRSVPVSLASGRRLRDPHVHFPWAAMSVPLSPVGRRVAGRK